MIVHAGGALAAIAAGAMLWLRIWLWLSIARVRDSVRAVVMAFCVNSIPVPTRMVYVRLKHNHNVSQIKLTSMAVAHR